MLCLYKAYRNLIQSCINAYIFFFRFFFPYTEDPKSTEKQESEKRIKMQQEVVEVLETNAKSKKCNPVEAGLYKFKAWKLDSGIFFTVMLFP